MKWFCLKETTWTRCLPPPNHSKHGHPLHRDFGPFSHSLSLLFFENRHVVSVQNAITERDELRELVTRLQAEIKSKNEVIAKLVDERSEKENGVEALVDLVEKQHIMIKDLMAAADL